MRLYGFPPVLLQPKSTIQSAMLQQLHLQSEVFVSEVILSLQIKEQYAIVLLMLSFFVSVWVDDWGTIIVACYTDCCPQ